MLQRMIAIALLLAAALPTAAAGGPGELWLAPQPIPAADSAEQIPGHTLYLGFLNPGPPPERPEPPDLYLEALDLPTTAEPAGFTVQMRVLCSRCDQAVTTSVSLRIGGFELPRIPVTFEPGQPSRFLAWETGPLPAGESVEVLAMIDPENRTLERDEGNNALRAEVTVSAGPSAGEESERWGSRLID